MRRTAMLATVLVLSAGLGALLWRESARSASPRTDLPALAAPETTPAELVEAPSILAPDPAAPHATPARTELEVGASSRARSIFVRVVSAVSFVRDSERVGHVAFRIYPPPLAGSHGPHLLVPESAPIFEGRTDANGEARVELEFAKLPLPQLFAGVVEPGFQQRLSLAREALDGQEACELRLLALRGVTARGRVVDAEGRGANAQVSLRVWGLRDGVRQLQKVGGASALNGRFELHLVHPVDDGVLTAEAGGAGTASLTGVTIALDHPPTDLTLVLRGDGTLRGRLVDRSGAPAASVEMLVLLAELDDERGSFVPPEPQHSLRQIEGLGRTWVTFVSARDGSFEMRGLRPEAYSVRARAGQAAMNGYPVLLTPTPVQADGAELVLRMARPHVVVRLLDAEGRACAPPDPRSVASPNPGGKCSRWPAKPVVRVFLGHVADDGTLVATNALRGKVLPTGECAYDVSEGARCLVSVLGGGFDGVPREVEVPPGQDRVEVELRARELDELGAVAVLVFHEGLELSGRTPPFSVRLEHVASAVVVTSCEGIDSPTPYVLRGAPGAYRVVVEGETWSESQHGTVTSSRTIGRMEAEVELRAGLTQELVLEVDAGANLEIRLEGTSTEADLAVVAATCEWLDEDELRVEASKVRLHLHHPERPPEPVLFDTPLGPTPVSGKYTASTWPLGKTLTSARLPTGRTTLVGRLPGGREARAEVELRAGETTAVTLRF